jgi:O-antigen/teichoic acid export membrane protein
VRLSGLLAAGRASTLSIGAGVAGQLALVVSGVVAARILGAEDRGHLALFALFPAVLAQFGSLGIPLAVTFYVARDPSETGRVVRTAAVFAGAQALGILGIHSAVLAVVFESASSHVRDAAVYTLAVGPSSLALHYALALLQGQGRLSAFNALRVVGPLAYSAWLVALLVADAGDLAAVTVIWVVAAAGVAAASLIIARVGAYGRGAGYFPPRPMLAFGMKSVIGSVSPVESLRLDQAIVGLALSPAALGIYVVGMAFTNLPRFIAQSIGLIAYPEVARQTSAQGRVAALWRFTLLTVLLCGPLVIALEIVAGKLVPLFFGPEFYESIAVTRVLLLSAFFLGIRRVLTDGARGAGRTLAGSAAEAASWVVLVPSVAVLAPLWGVNGVAVAVVLSSFTSLAILVAHLLAAGFRGGPPQPVVEDLEYVGVGPDERGGSTLHQSSTGQIGRPR